MSHYSVMVCLPGETESVEKALSEVLAPFDENMDVEPYRDYEDGPAENFWWVEAVRRGAAHLKDGTGILPHDPDGVGWRSDRSNFTSDEQRAIFAEDAEWAAKLGEHPGWREVVLHYNAKFYPGNEVVLAGAQPEEFDGLWYEPETDRAYKMSTYNPESKWDYWRIGGRWSGYFVADESLEDIIAPERHWDGPDRPRYPGRTVCDGGRKRSLDFAAMREHAALEAGDRYDRWIGMVERYGPIEPWSRFRDQVDVTLTIAEARKLYHDQPLVAAHDKLPYEEQLTGFMGPSLDEEFGTTREEYLALARAGAVPTYAMVTLAGEWTAPGRMGWFGMSSDGPGEREGYHVAVNRYLDELKPDTWLVVVDCHI